MKLDIRLPMGCLFLLLGLILIGFGFVSDPAIYQKHSLGININLLWGGCFAVFGAAMLLLVRWSKAKAAKLDPQP